MKKLVIIFATLGLMFQVAGCKSKKAMDETEIVENADVEKIEAEEANFAGDESSTPGGAVDESLQAALGEAPQDGSVSSDSLTSDLAGLDPAASEVPAGSDIAATPTLDEANLGFDPTATVASGTETGLNDVPAIEPGLDLGATDPSLTPDVAMAGGGAVTEMTPPPSPIAETPVIETPGLESASPTDTYASTERASTPAAKPTVAASGTLRKLAETEPYAFGDGFVNTVYIARPKEKLSEVSLAIYGADKTKDLKKINPKLKNKFAGGEKIYYVSPNRPTDSSKTVSFYEDTGMISEVYTAKAGDNLKKVAKNLLGYDSAWKEVWTTNGVASKGKLSEGETLRYWKPAPMVEAAVVAKNSSPPPEQMPVAPPPPVEEQPAVVAQNELPPPPPPPADVPAMTEAPPTDPMLAQNEMPPPPPSTEAQMPPPPPPADAPAEAPHDLASAPMPANQNMEEEPAAEGMSHDTMMIGGVVVVLCMALAFLLIRKNKKRREEEMSSIEQNHVI